MNWALSWQNIATSLPTLSCTDAGGKIQATIYDFPYGCKWVKNKAKSEIDVSKSWTTF
uniref:Uncharacterized protein n=1 Tax=Rhizophora mucronata TaxID=61149 RepID=A0A2P2INX9_RHIMU